MDDVNEAPLRSIVCNRESPVRFYNGTSRNVDVIWINYEGQGVKYRTLEPRKFLDVKTYVSHPWIFRDSSNYNKMVVCIGTNKTPETVFHPKPYIISDESKRKENARERIIIIKLPLYSLKERCFQILRDHNIRVKDLRSFHLPWSVNDEYYEYLNQISGQF